MRNLPIYNSRGEAIEQLRIGCGAFRTTFGSITGQLVLRELADYCYATTTTLDAEHTDPSVAMAREGRRQVFLRIMEKMRLSPDELYDLYGGKTIQILDNDGE